jgi:tetratricopeptide (TPR) repeat protein
VAAWGWLAAFTISFAAEVPRVTTAPPRPQRLYDEAKARWQKETKNPQAAWEFGRACYDWADHATNDTQRAALGHEGIDACRAALALAPSNAPAHYYLGLNCGQLAQTKLLGALKLVDQMEEAWTKTIALDPAFDYAGGHRALGILYRDAPGWPTSLGGKKKARLHLLKAVELAPDYPGNKLSLLESLAQWGEKKTVQDQAAATETYLSAARARLTGDQWSSDWRDWNRQWDRIKAKCAVVPARSPRG